MNQADTQYAMGKLAFLRAHFQVDVVPDWGDSSGTWQPGLWAKNELDQLENILDCFSSCIGGPDNLKKFTGGVTVRKADIGSHGGEALAHQVSLSTKGPFSAWTVVHELSHTWDANHNWGLSRALEKYTGGFTSPWLAYAKRLIGGADCAPNGPEEKPGRRGRLPGCNAAGYFYGDKPSGSNWMFNRVEDFAESVAMYVAWGRNNDLSNWAHARVNRYTLADGASDPNFGVDNWATYKKYFYPDGGDYAKTKRWQFVDELVKGQINVVG